MKKVLTVKTIAITLLLLGLVLFPVCLKAQERTDSSQKEVPITVTEYRGYYREGNSLQATSIEKIVCTKSLRAIICDTGISFMGELVTGKALNVFLPLERKAISTPFYKESAYEVLAVFPLESFVRTVLIEKGQNNMVFADIPADERLRNIESYRFDWFTEFVPGRIQLEETVTEEYRNSTSVIYKLYSSITDIYGDEIKEYIRLKAIQSYPQTINNSTGGAFYFTLGIRNKWTEYTPWGGNTVTHQGSSLWVNHGEINLATPKGDYFSDMFATINGIIQNPSPSPLSIGYNLNIPNTPFSITYSYSYTFSEQPGNTSIYKSFPAANTKCTQAGHYWNWDTYRIVDADPNGVDVGHFFNVKVDLDTDINCQVLGYKSMSFRWDYCITGSGVNAVYNIAVETPSLFDSINSWVFYTLTEAP